MFCSPALNAIEIGMRTRPRKPQRSLPFAGPGPRAAGAQPAGIYMTKASSPRTRKVRVLATLGPASSPPEMIEKPFLAGADAFRVNISHGDQQTKIAVIEGTRGLGKKQSGTG